MTLRRKVFEACECRFKSALPSAEMYFEFELFPGAVACVVVGVLSCMSCFETH